MRRAVLALSGLLALTGCGAAEKRPLNDSEQMVQSVLGLLASDGKGVCTDDRTEGQALAIFREMTFAPRPSREELRWHAPLPLRPPVNVTGSQLRESELEREQLTIREPDVRKDALPSVDQMRLTGAARYQGKGVGVVEESVAIRTSWAPQGVASRWWPLNRVRRDCWPLFLISDPIRTRDTGFITVRTEHWGTLYALQKTGTQWRVVAEWSRWLY